MVLIKLNEERRVYGNPELQGETDGQQTTNTFFLALHVLSAHRQALKCARYVAGERRAVSDYRLNCRAVAD
ncbi:hypothetical protein J6590_097135 [Homalodisca vitripennis]|nr:hypothetical protein J6590_097135 [Homalodisca vitripennis]